METVSEWEFIRAEIWARRTVAGARDEWHIGLRKKSGKWIWTSGTELDWAKCTNSAGCFPWQAGEPSGWPEDAALMSSNYPVNTKGLFNDIKRDSLTRSFICERPAGLWGLQLFDFVISSSQGPVVFGSYNGLHN